MNESLAAVQKSVELAPYDPVVYNNLGNVLHELGRLDEAEARYKQAIAIKADFAEAHKNLGNTLAAIGKLSEAQESYKIAILSKPDNAEAHNNLAVALLTQGSLKEAEASLRQATALDPNYAEAHSNLGITLRELGRLEEAKESYARAIALKPDYAEAHSNLGVTLKELGRLEEAIESYARAIALKPDCADPYSNLGTALTEVGRASEAIRAFAKAIELKPDFTAPKANLGRALTGGQFQLAEPQLYPSLINLLTTGSFVRPRDVSKAITSLLKHDPLIKDFVSGEAPLNSLALVTSAIGAFHKLPLLHQLMRVCPLPDLEFEEIFTAMRKLLLKERARAEVSPELTHFLSTLATHCFINEYVYFESDEETQWIHELEIQISETIEAAEQPSLMEILCCGCYRPLHGYSWCVSVDALHQCEDVKARLIDEPLLEIEISKKIPSLGQISDTVSSQVKEQYEENPYPRWINLGIHLATISIADLCDKLELRLRSNKIREVDAPEILVAGCGTGQHSIGTASRFTECQVTAIDLSFASLGYAERKTRDLGVGNIKYVQADILDLYRLQMQYDIIECVGVLHHMEDPMTGWHVLTDLLRPNGLMKIGLYSELARSSILSVREEIALLNIDSSARDIRQFRRSLVGSQSAEHQQISSSKDFFSLSDFRDLIFHVQEHLFTIPQLKHCLDELGLVFCGFEDQRIVKRFRSCYGIDADIYDLELWDCFEQDNPQAFISMYQFWCQKA